MVYSNVLNKIKGTKHEKAVIAKKNYFLSPLSTACHLLPSMSPSTIVLWHWKHERWFGHNLGWKQSKFKLLMLHLFTICAYVFFFTQNEIVLNLKLLCKVCRKYCLIQQLMQNVWKVSKVLSFSFIPLDCGNYPRTICWRTTQGPADQRELWVLSYSLQWHFHTFTVCL